MWKPPTPLTQIVPSFEDSVQRIRLMLGRASREDIHEKMVVEVGMTENDFFFAYQMASLLEDRAEQEEVRRFVASKGERV